MEPGGALTLSVTGAQVRYLLPNGFTTLFSVSAVMVGQVMMGERE